MKRFLLKLCLLLLLAAAVLCFCTSCAGNSYDGVADAYLNAFTEFDYKTMYELLTPGSQGRVSLEEFTQYHKKVYDMLKIETVSLTRGDCVDNGISRSYNYIATFTSSEYGDFSYPMQLEVYKKAKFYLVAWTPANVIAPMDWNDRILTTTTHGKRGEIFDRDGRIIVKNDYAVTVYAQKDDVRQKDENGNEISGAADAVFAAVARVLEQDEAAVRKKFDTSPGTTGIFYTCFKGELTQEAEDALAAIEGVKVDRSSITPIRYYPYGEALAQTLGYSTPVTTEDREKEKYRDLPEGTRIGRSGLEAAYDDELQPVDGKQIYLLSDDSKRKTVLFDQPARDGYDLRLTVNILYQKSIIEYMDENYKGVSTGTANIVNPKTGAVVALASYPAYDANVYAFDKATNFGDLFENPDTPQLNRNVQGTYPPGSIFKSIMALIGLDSGKVSTGTVFPYEGEIEYYTYEKDRWRPRGSNWSNYIVRQAFRNSASGRLDMHRALTWSDNIYFGWLAMQVGKENMIDYAARIGIGESIPFDLKVKASQLANSFDTLNSKKLLADTGFGQAEMLFSPLQLCCTFSLFGNEGSVMEPYIVESICATDEQGNHVPVKTHEIKVWKQNLFPASTVMNVRNILEDTAKSGTGKNGCSNVIKTMRIAAKTGTAQTGTTDTGEIGWFAGLVIDGGEQAAVLVSSEESDLKFGFMRHILPLLQDPQPGE